jgi:hypothetical protein
MAAPQNRTEDPAVVESHAKTWAWFTRFVTWSTVAVVVTLVLLALFLL